MGIDRGELNKLIVDLGNVPRDMRGELGPGVRDAGEIIADEMRRRSDWSTRIPGAISVHTAGAHASITVSSIAAPHARPYEGLSGDPFRHPVYGGPAWVDQAARPFFFDSADAKHDEAVERMGRRVDRVLDRNGF
jgi:hypothetical protein